MAKDKVQYFATGRRKKSVFLRLARARVNLSYLTSATHNVETYSRIIQFAYQPPLVPGKKRGMQGRVAGGVAKKLRFSRVGRVRAKRNSMSLDSK